MPLPVDPWDPVTETNAITKYVRSWRSEEFTDFGVDPQFVAHMQQVVVDENDVLLGSVLLPEVRRRMSDVLADPDVQQYITIKTNLLKKWWLEDEAARAAAANPPTA